MSKVDNLKRVIGQSKKYIIIIAVLWVFLTIVLVSPIAYAIGEATMPNGSFNMTIFIEQFVSSIISFTSITKIFASKYFSIFGSCLLWFTVIFLFASLIGFWKSRSKSDYHDIEHGSSDWSVNGEQYKVLSKTKGLILAEDNYLPLNKRGNLNALIVGRFRFW